MRLKISKIKIGGQWYGVDEGLKKLEKEAAKERKATSNIERGNFTPSSTGKSLDKE